MKQLLLRSSIVVIALFAFAEAARSATFTVTNTNDAGPGSLRQAIAESATNFQDDTIIFDVVLFSTPQTILLTTGELVVLNDVLSQGAIYYKLSILGPGADLLTIDANNQSRILRKASGGTAELEISGMTIKRGFATKGGAVFSEGALVIVNSVIAESTAAGAEDGPGQFYAGRGGGVYSHSLTLVNTVVRDNTATGIQRVSGNPEVGDSGTAGAGGGVFVAGFNPQIVNCTFVRNLARGFDAPQPPSDRRAGGGGAAYGGALYTEFHVVIVNSRFIENSAIGGDGSSMGILPSDGGPAWGGALRSSGPIIMNSTFTGNLSHGGDSGVSAVNPGNSLDGKDALGGAIFGDPKLVNVTIADNRVIGGDGKNGGRGAGGGVFAGDNEFRAINSTITGNSAVGGIGNIANGNGEGGGFHAGFQSGPARTFLNNIVADNLADTGPDVHGLFPNAQNNLVRIGAGSAGMEHGVNGNLVGDSADPIDPMLGPLSDNGGLTFTRLPLEGSPAIDSGTNTATNPITSQPLTVDQRNFVRIWPVGGTMDRGSVEVGTPEALPTTSIPDLHTLSDSGASNTDNITMSTSPRFDVESTIPGAYVELLRDGNAVSSRTAVTFTTSLTDPAPPLDGSVVYAVRQTVDGVSVTTANSLSVTFDHTAPTATLNQAATQADPARLSPYNFTAVFSERVNGAGTISFQGSSANVSNAFSNRTSQDGITWNIAVSGVTSNGGFIVANIVDGSYSDIAGNSGSASTSTDNVIVIDNVRPSVSVNQSPVQQDPAFSQPVVFVVEFSEKAFGLEASDFSFSGSTADLGQASVELSGEGQFYSVTISNIRSSGLIRLSLPANRAQDELGNLNLASTSTDNSVFINIRAPAFDFDGDGRADIGVYRPSEGNWYALGSQAGFMGARWGLATDELVAADYDGDGKTDRAIFRDGVWWVLKSTGGHYAMQWGLPTDIPVPVDYDGDGKADLAIVRNGVWWILRSSGGPFVVQWGFPTDIPVPADYDGDGQTDIAIVRDGVWWVRRSSGGHYALQWGLPTDIPVPADYDGDGKADIAVLRDGVWWVLKSTGGHNALQWGLPTDIPVPADYDGDGKTDIAIVRDGIWWIRRSTGGHYAIQWGLSTDIPIPRPLSLQ